MEPLAYYAANAPPDFKPQPGRLAAAAVVFGMLALVVGWYALLILGEALRFRSEWPTILVVGSLAGTVSAFALTLMYGLILRRRWSRPLALATTVAWLTQGTAAMTIMTLDDALRRYRYGGRYAWDVSEFTIVSYAYYAFLWVGLPLFLRRLLGPDDVRRTLERADPKSTWTDAVPLPWITLAGNLLLLAGLTGFAASANAASGWDRVDATSHALLAVAVLAVLGAAVAAVLGRHAVAFGLSLAAAAVAVRAAWVSASPGGYHGINETPALCFLVAGYAIAVMQALRRCRAAGDRPPLSATPPPGMIDAA